MFDAYQATRPSSAMDLLPRHRRHICRNRLLKTLRQTFLLFFFILFSFSFFSFLFSPFSCTLSLLPYYTEAISLFSSRCAKGWMLVWKVEGRGVGSPGSNMCALGVRRREQLSNKHEKVAAIFYLPSVICIQCTRSLLVLQRFLSK